MSEITPRSGWGATAFAAESDAQRLARLNAEIARARRLGRFYSARLPEALGSLGELEALPFTTAEDIREHGPAMVCVPAQEVARIVTLRTSGTQGRPKRLYFTRGDLERTVTFFADGMAWMCRPGDRVGVFMPCASPDGLGDLLARGLARIGTVPLLYGMVGALSDVLPRFRSERPQVLVGLPWQIRLLALAAPEVRPRVVLLSADFVPESLYALLGERWGCETLSHYGMTETGLGGAVESFAHSGLLLRRDELYAEVIDPGSGRVLPPGETGEIVLTTLRREAMPLFRYRTGDLGRLTADGSGNIGRVLWRHENGIAHKSAPEFLAKLQELLCPETRLWDYSAAWSEREGRLTLAAQVSGDEAGCVECIKSAAESLEPFCPGMTVEVRAGRVPAEEAHAAYPAKRAPIVV